MLRLVLRYLGISIIKWFGVFTVTLVFARYVAPDWMKGYALALPTWALISFVAYGFAFWAMHIKMPGKHEIITLLLVWIIVTFCLQAFFEIMAFGSPVFLLRSPDLYIQYLIEIASIMVAARVLRKRKMRAVSGEGIAV